MLDVFSIAVQVGQPPDAPDLDDEQGYLSFESKPADLYPATIEHVRLAATKPRPDGALGQLWDVAVNIPEYAWELGLVPPADCDAETLPAREQALETARLWFTEMLHQAVGAPIHLHILRDETFKLRP